MTENYNYSYSKLPAVPHCPAGFIGSYCESKCSYPFFGQDCQKKCQCPEKVCLYSTGCPRKRKYYGLHIWRWINKYYYKHSLIFNIKLLFLNIVVVDSKNVTTLRIQPYNEETTNKKSPTPMPITTFSTRTKNTGNVFIQTISSTQMLTNPEHLGTFSEVSQD